MKIIDWFGRIFSRNEKEIILSEYRNSETGIMLEAFALFTTIEMIAGLISKCRFKTYINNQETKGLEWYSLNIRPNRNQNSTQFWYELVCKLLYYREVLVIDTGGQKIIADDFQKTEYAVLDTVFTDVSRKDFTFNRSFKMSEVLYLRYGTLNSQSIIDNIFLMYENLIASASEKYKKSGVEKGYAVIGIAKNYFMGIGTAKGGKLEYDDSYKFLEDLRTYTIRLYGNGRPTDINSFLYLDIRNLRYILPTYEIISGSTAAE